MRTNLCSWKWAAADAGTILANLSTHRRHDQTREEIRTAASAVVLSCCRASRDELFRALGFARWEQLWGLLSQASAASLAAPATC